MNDEDIQYLGRRSPINVSPLTPGRQSDFVTGFVLHVEKSANEPENELVFWRSDHSIIHIGRRPANPTTTESNRTPDNAMFRCAVVSRKHAKIVFSDSGTVYIVDTNSHHGTHILKVDSTSAASKQIPSETPTQLFNGDIITFGKTVGRTNEFVTPIVARVELMHAPRFFSRPVGATTPVRQPSNQEKTIDLTALSTPPPTFGFIRSPTTIPSPSIRGMGSSGRYGLNSDVSPFEISSSSSSDSEDIYENGVDQDIAPDSDIEELPNDSCPASGANALPIVRRRLPSLGSIEVSPVESHPPVEIAPAPAPGGSTSRLPQRALEIFEVLKNLIPPVSIPGVGPSSDLPQPPSPSGALMQSMNNDSMVDNVVEASIDTPYQQAQASEDANLYRPNTPSLSPPFSTSSGPMRLHIEPIAHPISPGFERPQNNAMFDIFDVPSTPPHPHSPPSMCGDLPSPPWRREVTAFSPVHSPPHFPDPIYNPIRASDGASGGCSSQGYSFQPDSIFTQGVLDKERQRDLQGDAEEQDAERVNRWNFTPSPISRSPSPSISMKDGEYERFQDPDPEFEPFCWHSQKLLSLPEIAPSYRFSPVISSTSSALDLDNDEEAREERSAGAQEKEKEREDSPMELESVDGENQQIAPSEQSSSASVDVSKKRLTLSERLELEREELERRLKEVRRVTMTEEREDEPTHSNQVPENTSEPIVEVPTAAPSLGAKKAMSLDSICSSDISCVAANVASSSNTGAGAPDVDQVTRDVNSLKSRVNQLHLDLLKTQAQQKRSKSRLSNSVRSHSEGLAELDDKVEEAVKQCASIAERMDNIMDMDMPELVGQVEHLREVIEAKNATVLQDAIEKNHDGLEKERQEVMEHVELLKSLVEDMRRLRGSTEEQMKAELDAVRIAKEEAIKAIEAHVKAQLAQKPSPAPVAACTIPMKPVSLKRKRNDDGEDDEGGENEAVDDEDADCPMNAVDELPALDVDSRGSPLPPSSAFMAPEFIPDYELSQPPRKRTRRIVKAAAQTATAVTVGAIAAWSALAFS